MNVWPARIIVVIALAALGLSAYSFLELRDLVDDNTTHTQENKDRIHDNEVAIAAIRALTLRISKIDRPTTAQFRAGIARSLRKCAADSTCRLLFGRLSQRAQREVLRRGAISAPRGSAPTGSPGSGSPPSGRGRGRGHRTPQTGGGGQQGNSGGGSSGSSPGGNGGGGGGGQRPPFDVTVPLPIAPVCTPLVGLNCPR